MPRLVVVSNRGPVAWEATPNGLQARPPQGGLAPILTGALSGRDALWVCAALTDGDRLAARRGTIDVGEPRIAVRYLEIPAREFLPYYEEASNRMLWFAHHDLWSEGGAPTPPAAARRAWRAYADVNRRFARAVRAEDGSVVLVQDYHLALLPRLLRRSPKRRIAHFSHTPFADPEHLAALPAGIGRSLLEGMLGADVVGFHADAWADRFVENVRRLPNVRVRGRAIRVGERTVRVGVYPVAVDAGPLRAAASSPAVSRIRRRMRSRLGDARLLLRADRLELSKNALRGFRAFEAFLAANPAWVGRVRFLALLSPSRMSMREYRSLADACEAEARRINRAFGRPGWTPIDLRIRDDHEEVLAAYGIYDALLVNPVADGLNLVALEGPIVNESDGVLILSRNTGAWERMGRSAIGINPFDVAQQAVAIRRALEMGPADRARRARGLARAATAVAPSDWLDAQLAELGR